jgi:hypothetical protein
MMLIGTPTEWVDLIDTLVPDILDLVISTWEEMPPPAPDALEDPTTEELCKCLRQNRNNSNLPFRIDIQMVELDPAAGQDQGRMDIAFSPMVPRENIYFCLECKRLNVISGGQFRTLATEYVTEGLIRFISEQYSSTVQHGGMLGYVLDGKVKQAIQKIIGAIQARHVELGMEPPGDVQLSSVRPSDTCVRETHHTRQHNNERFQVHHIFVAGA